MNKQHNVINMLLNFIGKSTKIEEKEKIVLLINAFFSKGDGIEIPNLDALKISGIDILETDNEKMGIVIELMEPGLLVGKDGNTVKQLGGFLSKKLDKRVRVFVENTTKEVNNNLNEFNYNW